MSMRASSSTVRRPKATSKKDFASTVKDICTVFREILSKSTQFSSSLSNLLLQKLDNQHCGQLNVEHDILSSLYDLQQTVSIQLKYLTTANSTLATNEVLLDQSSEFVPGDFGKVSELMAFTQQQLLVLLKHTGVDDIHITSKVWELFSSLNVNIWNKCFSGKYTRDTESPGKDFRKKIIELTEYNTELKRQNYELTDEIQHLHSNLSAKDEEINQIGRMSVARRPSYSGERDSNLLKNELTKSYDRIRFLSDELQDKSQLLERKDMQIAELTNELCKLQKDYQASLFNFESQIDQFRTSNTGYKSPNRSFSSYQTEIEFLKDQVVYLKDERDKVMRTSFTSGNDEIIIKKMQSDHDKEVAKLKEHVEHLRKRVNESTDNSKGPRAQSQTRSMNKIQKEFPTSCSTIALEDQLKKERERSLTLYRALKRKEKECDDEHHMAPDTKKLLETVKEKLLLENKVNEMHGHMMRLKQDYQELQKIYNLQGEKFRTLEENSNMSKTFTFLSRPEDLNTYTAEEIIRPKTSQSRQGLNFKEFKGQLDSNYLKASTPKNKRPELDEKSLMKQIEKLVITKTLEINQVLGQIEDELDEKTKKLKLLESKINPILAHKSQEAENLQAEKVQLKQSYDRYMEKYAKVLATAKEENSKTTVKFKAEMEKQETYYKLEIAKLHKEKVGYESKQKLFREEIEKLKSELKTSEKLAKYNQELEDAFKDQAEKIQELQQHLKSSKSTNCPTNYNSQEIMELFNIFWKNLCNSVDSIAESVDSLENRSNRFEQRLSECKSLKEKNQKLNEIICLLDRNNKENQQNLQNIDKQYNGMIQELQTENQALHTQYEQLTQAQDSFQELQSVHETLQYKHDTERTQLKNEMERMKADTENKVSFYENKIKSLEVQYKEIDFKNTDSIKQLRIQIEKLHKDNADLEQEFKNAFTDYQEQVCNMDGLNKELIDRLNSAELEHTEEIDKLRTEINELMVKKRQLQDEVSELRDKNGQLKQALNTLKSNKTTEEQLVKYQEQIDSLQSLNYELTKRNNNLEEVYETEIKSLKQKKNSCDTEISALNAQFCKLKKDLQESEYKYTNLQEDKQRLYYDNEIKIQTLEIEVDRLNCALDSRQEENLEEMLQIKINYEALQEKYDADCIELKDRNYELTRKIEDLEREADEKEIKTTEMESELVLKIQDLEKELENSTNTQIEDELKIKIEELERKLEEKDVKNGLIEIELTMKIEDLESEIETELDRNRELEVEIRTNAQEGKERETRLREKIEELERQIEAAMSSQLEAELSDKVENLEKELEAEKAKNNQLEEELKLKIQELETELQSKVSKNDQLEEELKLNIQQLETELQSKVSKNNQLEEELKLNIQQLETELQSQAAKIIHLEFQNSELDSKNQSISSVYDQKFMNLISLNSDLSQQFSDLQTQHKLKLSSLSEEYEACKEDYEKEVEFFKKETQDLDSNNQELLCKIIQLEKRDADEYKKLVREYSEFKFSSEQEIDLYKAQISSDKLTDDKLQELEEKYSNEISRLQHENQQLSDEILKVKDTETTLSADNQKLMNQAETTHEELTRVTDPNFEIQKEMKQMSELSKLHEVEVKDQMKSLQYRVQELTDQNIHLNSELLSRNEEIDKLFQDLDDLQNAYKEKDTQVSELQEELKNKSSNSLEYLQDLKQNFTSLITEFWNQVCSSFKLYEDLLDSMNYSTDLIGSRLKELSTQFKQAKSLEGKLIDLQVINYELNTKLEEINSRNIESKLEEMHRESDRKMMNYENKINSLENQCEMYKDQLDSERNKSSTLKERVSKLENEEKSLKYKLNTEEENHKTEILHLNEQLHRLEAERQTLEEVRNSIEQDCAYEINRLNTKIEELNEIIRDLKVENDILNNQSSSQDQEYAEELIRLDRKNDELKETINELKIDNELLDSQNNTSAEAFLKLQAENEELTLVVAELESSKKTVLEQIMKIEKQYSEDVPELQIQNEQLKSQIKQLERANQASESQENESLKVSVEELEYKNSALNEKLASIEQLYTDELVNLKSHKEELKEHISIIEAENNILLYQAKVSEQTYQELNSEIVNLQRLIQEAHSQAATDAQKIQKYIDYGSMLISKIEELQLLQEAQLSDQSNKELIDELQAVKKQYNEDISKMNQKYSALEAEHKNKIADLNLEIHTLQTKNETLNNQNLDLQDKNVSLVQYQDSLYDSELENFQLKEKLDSLSRENEEYISQLEASAQYEAKYNEQLIENEKLSDEVYNFKLHQAERKSVDLSNKQLLDEMSALEQKYALKLDRAERERQDLADEYDNKISSLSDQLTQIQIEKTEIELEIQDLQEKHQNETSALKCKAIELTSKIEHMEQNSSEQLDSYKEMLEKQEKELKESKEWNKRYEDESKEIADIYECEVQKLQQENSQLRVKKDKKESELVNLFSRYNDTSSELDQQKEIIKELQRNLSLASQSGQNISHDFIDHLKDTIKQNMDSFYEDINNQMEFLSYSLENSETKLGELQLNALKSLKETKRSKDLFDAIKQRELAYGELLAQHNKMEKSYSDYKLKCDHDIQELIEQYEEKISLHQSKIDYLTSQLTQTEQTLQESISRSSEIQNTLHEAVDSDSEVLCIGESSLISPMKRKSLNNRGLISLSDEEYADITPIKIPEYSKTESPTSTYRADPSIESPSMYDPENNRLFLTISRLQDENHELENTIHLQNDQLQLLQNEIRKLRGHMTTSSEVLADPITIKNMFSNLISSLPELNSNSESAIHSLMTVLGFDSNDKEKCDNLRKSKKITEKVKKSGLKKLFERKKKN